MERTSSRPRLATDSRADDGSDSSARAMRLRPVRTLAAQAWCALAFFALALTGAPKPPAVTVLLLVAGAAFAGLIVTITAIAAVAESMLGRAWAGGFRVLPAAERGRIATTARALAYARTLWVANGAALWVAAITSR